MKILLRLLLAVLAVTIVFFTGLFVTMSLADLPEFAWRVLRYGESDTQDYKIFPSRLILNGEKVSRLDAASAAIPPTVTFSYAGRLRTENIADLIQRTDTKAFIVIRDDRVVYENYPNSSRDAINTSFSAAKSFNSAMIGAAIADGYIKSVDDPVVRYVPEIAGRGLDALTIRDLLLMNSGIRYLNNDEIPFYRTPFGDDALTYYAPDIRKIAMSVQAGGSPTGAAFHYDNYHPLLEGLVLERATGMHVAEYLQERFWKPMGAEFPATWSLDSTASGFEKMESGINARAIDYARFGLVFLHDGFWNGAQILPEAWVRTSTTPLKPDPRTWETMKSWPDHGGYYKYHWWGLNNPDGSYDFFANGKYDQVVYVAPRKNAVIVRLGNAPDENLSWGLVIQALVDQLP